MKQLKRRDGTLIHEAEGTLREVVLEAYRKGLSLIGASLNRASLFGASLIGASLDRASLDGASLIGASLDGASLIGASLDGASLIGASLNRATGISPERCTPLLMLLDQPGPIRAYKLVTADGVGPFNRGITYTVGESYEVPGADTDPSRMCPPDCPGIYVATLDWCLKEWQPGFRILLVEFTAADIAAIPTATDGKFRLHRCRVVGEKDLPGLLLAAEEAPQ